MMGRASVVFAVGGLVLSSSFARSEDNAQFRTAVSVTGGLSVGSEGPRGGVGGDLAGRFGFGGGGSDAGFAVGAGIAHDVSPRLTVEANGAYLDRRGGGWSADAGLRLNLVPASRSMVPYFAVSGGLFGGDSGGMDMNGLEQIGQKVMGYLDPRMPQPGFSTPGTPQNGRAGNVLPVVTAVRQQIPSFASGRSYTDAMLTMGGGVRFDAGPHVFVRPDVRAQLVFSNSTRVLGLFTLNFGYRF
jgi:hypothetical protein